MTDSGPLTVEDRLDIMDLLARYGACIDSHDGVAYAALWAPDGVRRIFPTARAKRIVARRVASRFVLTSRDQLTAGFRKCATLPASQSSKEIPAVARCARIARYLWRCLTGRALSTRWLSTEISASRLTAAGCSRSAPSTACSTVTTRYDEKRRQRVAQ